MTTHESIEYVILCYFIIADLAYVVASLFAMLITAVSLIIMTNHVGPAQYSPIRIINDTIRKHQVSSNNVIGTIDLDKSMETPNSKRKTYISIAHAEWNTSSLLTWRNIVPSLKTVNTGMSKLSSVAKTTFLPVSTTTNMSKEFYVCVKYIGRIGNKLFQFASGYGIAASKGMKLVVGVNDKIYQIFQIKDNKNILISTYKHECDSAIFRREHQASAYDENVEDFKPNATYRVGRYLQSWKYFHNVSRELREILRFRSHIQTKADNIMENILRKYNTSRETVTLIAIHVRRGDMVNSGHGYLVATKEYFEKAIQFFSSYLSPVYVVCSNGLTWSKANMPKNYTVEFIYGNSPEEDLALMASCDHMISSVGSYSWWAGWFTNGTVTYYKWPIVEDSKRRIAYSSDYMDYFYPHWIGL
ncbi:galactoside alpha-(1,2)-fucosyltransferase 2-like [Saccostrea echinata]|uniref:galactoside alpha-(1,2)-fucosyltransferase 2-like n=1 Tax=Saccostrea echinata TaxID=191078 RepID=UPI002A819703|nr:galactoside alpha-(1,2)-fucosyltransferase 2-like [Saccostrea echinata]